MGSAEIVYFVGAATSLACAVLLGRSYLRRKAHLLLWSALCFVGLALNNSLLFIDLVLLKSEVDLTILRTVCSFAGMALLFYGLIMDRP